MCLISVLPKGSPKYCDKVYSFIKQGISSNGQGSGFMYKLNDLVYVSKGYGHDKDINSLITDYKNLKLPDDCEVVFHHRISTVQGTLNGKNTHPFYITKDIDTCVKLTAGLKIPALAHNGMYHVDSYMSDGYSDSCTMANVILPDILNLLKNNPQFVFSHFKYLAGNRTAILFPDRDVLMLGNFVTDKDDKGNIYYHSNTGYEKYVYNYGGVEDDYPKHDRSTRSKTYTSHQITYSDFRLSWEVYDEKVGFKTLRLTSDSIKLNSQNVQDFLYVPKNITDSIPDEVYEIEHISGDTYCLSSKNQLMHLGSLDEDYISRNFKYLPKREKVDEYLDYLYLSIVRKNKISKNNLKTLLKKLGRSYNASALDIIQFEGDHHYVNSLIELFNQNFNKYRLKSNTILTKRKYEHESRIIQD